MDAIGQLAGGIAHDFNNVLTVILTSCASLVGHVSHDGGALAQLEMIRTAGERAARMTRQLMVFARDEPQPIASVDLGVIVTGMTAMLTHLIGDDVQLTTTIWPRLPPVLARSNEMEQLVMNLVVNARDAILDGGRIDVRVTSAGDRVVLIVTDTGCGMDEATRARIFEPFFTTKDVGAGTGLGLATVYAIVDRCSGTIEVESQPGRGTTFTVSLPAVAQPAVDAPCRGDNPVAALSGTVMVVEDNDAVRAVIRESLRAAGLHVLEARDGVEALELYGATADTIDLLVSDVLMPRMNGQELGVRLRERNPDAKVIFVSGYPEPARKRGEKVVPIEPILYKPFTPRELLAVVRAALVGVSPRRSGVGGSA
jgi:CheY-like chemotaxis protein/anti-sigma regulatory factor (Ser/Thr protein kinase)